MWALLVDTGQLVRTPRPPAALNRVAALEPMAVQFPSGQDLPSLLAGASGFVVWPAAGALAVGAFSTARLGVVWSHALPVARLRTAFAALLVVAALSTLFRFQGA